MCQSLLARAALGLGALLLVAGCATTPARFYMLSALPQVETASAMLTPPQGPTIGIGPVTLPRYLDRPQIVTRSGPYELKLAEFDRWVEPLDTNVTRVLADNLTSLLPTTRVVAHPWPRATSVDYQILVEVTHLLSQLGGESVLMADWSIFKGEGQQPLLSGKSRLSAPVAGQHHAAVVSAMSQTLADLSREIAAAAKGLGPRASRR
jgi:uncharacterized lipoprotein YmbA